MHRYPETTQTTVEIALAALKPHLEAVSKAQRHTTVWQVLSDAAAAAAAAADWPSAKALWLVSDCCSMMLRPDSINEPFGPLAVLPNGRSAVVDDFGADDLAVLSGIAESVEDRFLRARLSDVAWLCSKPRKVADALRAIDAYTSMQPDEENWFNVLKEWERAIALCRQVRQGAGNRLETIEAQLIAIAKASLPHAGGLRLAVARTLFGRDLAFDNARELADGLAQRAAALKAAKDFSRTRPFLELAGLWYERVKDGERSADMTLEIALSWEAEADERLQSGEAGGLVAPDFLENAIQTLRRIPRNYRAARGVDAHLQRLHQRLPEAGELALKAMKQITTGPEDITELVRRAQAAVSGKDLDSALREFCNLYGGARRAALKEGAEQSMREHPLSTLMGATHFGRDGRVVAKTPAGRLGQDDTSDYDEAVYATMMRNYQFEIDFVCQAEILPAAWTITSEHRIRKTDLVHLLSQSPVIPPGRAEQFGAGIFHGFEQDFASAIYILAPQVEHMVRWHLKRANVKTTNLDKDGIENENGLSALMQLPEVATIFGEDLTFELDALFCSALGPNLRNEVAHGLLSAAECNTTQVVYAWWRMMRLALNTYWKSAGMQAAAASAGAGTAGSDNADQGSQPGRQC